MEGWLKSDGHKESWGSETVLEDMRFELSCKEGYIKWVSEWLKKSKERIHTDKQWTIHKIIILSINQSNRWQYWTAIQIHIFAILRSKSCLIYLSKKM
jgi:hypothetical protein